MILLVSIGSTHFDALISACCSEEFYRACEKVGCTTVILQLGQGKAIPLGFCESGSTRPLKDFEDRNCVKGLVGTGGGSSVKPARSSSESSSSATVAENSSSGVLGGEISIDFDNGNITATSRRDSRFLNEHSLQEALKKASSPSNYGSPKKSKDVSSSPPAGNSNRIKNQIRVIWFRFTPDFDRILESVDVVICHAGAGSILGAIRKGKKTITVPNPVLMDNHQRELALAMAEGGYCCLAETVDEVAEKLVEWVGNSAGKGGNNVQKPFPACDRKAFYALIEEEIGVNPV